MGTEFVLDELGYEFGPFRGRDAHGDNTQHEEVIELAGVERHHPLGVTGGLGSIGCFVGAIGFAACCKHADRGDRTCCNQAQEAPARNFITHSFECSLGLTKVAIVLNRRLSGLFLLLGVLALLVVASIVIGTRTIAFGALVDMVNGVDIDAADAAVIQDLRIPRTILGIIVGAALGTAGTLIQGHTRNPLADPGIFGINAGAAFAVVVSFTFLQVTSVAGTVIAAFVGAIIATIMVFSFSGINPVSIFVGWHGLVGGVERHDERHCVDER